MNRSPTILFLCFVSLIWTISCRSVAKTPTFNTMTLHFPQQWHQADERPLDSIEKIEVRTLSNSPGDYFFAALQSVYNPVYSENSFAVKFTPSPVVRNATKQEWESGTRVVTESRIVVCVACGPSSGELEHRGRKYQKAGKYWHVALLSPGGKWLAIFSYTGERTKDFAFMDGGSVKVGDVFWEVYNTETGEKILKWEARDVKSPTNRSSPVVWLEERYFIFPADLDAQDFHVVTMP